MARTGSMAGRSGGVLSDPAAFASYQALQKKTAYPVTAEVSWGLSTSYPQLQSDANFQEPADAGSPRDGKAASLAARRPLHGSRPNFNTMVHTFPTDVTARVFDFPPAAESHGKHSRENSPSGRASGPSPPCKPKRPTFCSPRPRRCHNSDHEDPSDSSRL